MSRSIRKPYTAYSNGSNKADKKLANRKFRRVSKNIIEQGGEIAPIKLKEVSNVYSWPTDGLPVYYSEKEFGNEDWFKKSKRK